MRKLNLGCGPYHREGCVNIDANPEVKPDLLRDMRKGLPYDDDSVGEVWATHFLEHLGSVEMLDLVAEVYRVLVPNGSFTIGVPLGSTGCLDHLMIFEEASFDHLAAEDAAVYYHRRFRWEVVEKSLSEEARWRVLSIKLRAKKS